MSQGTIILYYILFINKYKYYNYINILLLYYYYGLSEIGQVSLRSDSVNWLLFALCAWVCSCEAL